MIYPQDKKNSSANPFQNGSLEPSLHFLGFSRPNVVQTPNQFLDVTCAHFPTPVIRVVAFLLYQHLAWHDADGNPLINRFHWSQREIAKGAGIAKSKVTEALRQAVDAKFLVLIKKGQKASTGQKPLHDIYEINWHDYPVGTYEKDPKKFKGFCSFDYGNFTNIPEEFFTSVIPENKKSVIRFVGAVLRHTIGQKTKTGTGRVTQTRLSYGYMKRCLNIASSTLFEAVGPPFPSAASC